MSILETSMAGGWRRSSGLVVVVVRLAWAGWLASGGVSADVVLGVRKQKVAHGTDGAGLSVCVWVAVGCVLCEGVVAKAEGKQADWWWLPRRKASDW
ncbi:hypothetical protein BC831DRAFT_483797 [Entophlyctis helioformis]|nr:hypothetical protein BC831DRAFT_483797 [Entophlyctis helioformis]